MHGNPQQKDVEREAFDGLFCVAAVAIRASDASDDVECIRGDRPRKHLKAEANQRADAQT